MSGLEGKVAIVTGSASGIGAAVARRFGAEGASVVVNSVRSVDAGREQFGHLDVLVNNAGTTEVIPHADLDAAGLDVWRKIFEVNVFAPWLLSRSAVPALRQSRGNIINVTSIAGVRPTGSSIPYAASKAALNHMTLLLANALGPDVRVNAVAPGLIDTPWTADWDAVRAYVRATAPMARSGTPEDVAEVALMLAVAEYVTGEVILVDGGMALR
jgi:ketoreductase RED2